MINIIDNGILYRNPLPQLRAIHTSSPFLQQISNEEFLCFYRRGTAWQSVDGVTGKLRSTDGGKTWVEEGVVWDGASDARPYCYRIAWSTKLHDGTLLLTVARIERSDPDKPVWNPTTEGCLPVDTVLFRSADGGRTWSHPQSVCLPESEFGNPAGPVIELSDGRWLMPFETWKPYDDPSPAKQRTISLLSVNEGKTWDNYTVIADGHDNGIYYWDTSLIAQKDGRLHAVMWTYDSKTKRDLPLHRALSEDEGRTWSTPESTGVDGHTMSVVDLSNDRMLMVYTLRNGERPGIMAVLSDDGGKTWDLSNQVMIWDGKVQSKVGSVGGEGILNDLATFAFGKPHAIQIADGSVLVGFWCTQACVTHIRWCRLTVI